ncbi:DarT ssDNA thymidine ADP-ribosyltransferase family protein [Pseudomonas sp. R5(2019)]|uniref:DarT ssDNA thymidine ADP-ribosyltransferase family protein n=1 Tax=Pseudomonas sp. R5(2019) TaxID=2697566 RepID=UPI0014134B0D|nr:DarT ssDNA thymidine ADP-ribosyltransferase family protein [Pseudomonas sp. R5(2019)]NBA94055.1 DUF4433 domain-containing protein [Pseudomonas sp. R5(2019)]
MPIRDQSLIYHLTSVANIPSILRRGLLPREQLQEFRDVADPEIIAGRRERQLENFVPFHWFAGNPFDGRVHRDRRDERFVLITVSRTLAEARNWRVIPRHPLAVRDIELLDYAVGVAAIDWDRMELRDYHDPVSKSVCMAECLSPEAVAPQDFFKIFTPSAHVQRQIDELVAPLPFRLWVDTNENMFPR